MVQALEKAGADKDFPAKVREGKGGDVSSTNDVCVPFWGVAERLLIVSALTGVGGPCHIPASPPAPGAGRELVSRVALRT